MMEDALSLAGVFSYLSLITLGGGIAVYPELSARVVDAHRWLTLAQLDYLYGVGQAAPGPNLVIVSIGAVTAGVVGATIALIAFVAPPARLAFVVGRLWTRLNERPWVVSIQRALTPISIGLLFAGCLTFASGALSGWITVGIMLVAFAAVFRAVLNPALLIPLGAVAGMVAFAHH